MLDRMVRITCVLCGSYTCSHAVLLIDVDLLPVAKRTRRSLSSSPTRPVTMNRLYSPTHSDIFPLKISTSLPRKVSWLLIKLVINRSVGVRQ